MKDPIGEIKETQMKTILAAVLAGLIAAPASASRDVRWPSDINEKDYTRESLKKKLIVAEEVLVLSLDGSHLYSVEQTGLATGTGGTTHYSARIGRKSFVVYRDTLREDDGRYGAEFTKYREAGKLGTGKGVGLIGKEKLYFKDFGAIVYELARTKDRKTVVRLTPFIPSADREPESVDEIRLGLFGMLIRNGKEVLTRGGGASGEVVTVSTPKLGTVKVSLRKFKGARPIGRVVGDTLSFELGEDRYEWITKRPIMPPGTWRVWVKHDKKSLTPSGVAFMGGAK